jgi:crotonobetainyl-CoA:carnitine CoA-transferase CaiB-like acyl-CoA transferase
MAFLDDVTVVDATQMMAGPMTSMYLGDLGAEVVKIEQPEGGELTRDYGPFVDGVSGYFGSLNRNKHCITLNLAEPEGVDVFYDLVADADVVLENFKPGTTERFGIDYDSVREINDTVVYCSISGFGRDSPYAEVPAFDMVAQAMGGAMSVTGEPDGPPLRSNVPMGDISATMFATTSILAALYERDVGDGGGEYVEVPLLNTMLAWMSQRVAHSRLSGEPYPRTGSDHREFTPYRNFETADSYLVVGVASESLWPKFCAAIDRPDLVDDPRFATNEARNEHADELYDVLDEILASRSTAEWFETMREYGVPAGPVYDTIEVWDDPHVIGEELLLELSPNGAEGTLPSVRYPVNFASDLPAPSPPQRLGAETDERLRELGYSEETIERLHADGIV